MVDLTNFRVDFFTEPNFLLFVLPNYNVYNGGYLDRRATNNSSNWYQHVGVHF